MLSSVRPSHPAAPLTEHLQPPRIQSHALVSTGKYFFLVCGGRVTFVSLRLANTRGRPSKIVSALCQIENPSAIDAHLTGSGCIGIAMDSDSEIPNAIPSARNRATHPSQHILWNCLSVERYSASPAKSYYISIDHRDKQH